MKKKHVNQTFPSGSMVRIQGKTQDVNGNPVAQIERFCKQTMNKENVFYLWKKRIGFPWKTAEKAGNPEKIERASV